MEIVDVEQEAVRRRGIGNAAGAKVAGPGAGQTERGGIGSDGVADQRQVGVMNDHAVCGITRKRTLDCSVEAGRKGIAPCLRGRVGGDFRQTRRIAGKEADILRSGRDQAIEIGGRAGSGELGSGGGLGGRSCKGARIIAADRDGDEVSIAKVWSDCLERGGCATGEERADFERKAGKSEILVIIVGARAADGKVLDRGVKQLRQRVDVIGAARKAPGRIKLLDLRARCRGRPGVAKDQRGRIIVVGEAVTEGDDAVDALRRGGCGAGERGGGEQSAREQAVVSHDKSSPMPLIMPRPHGDV